jgi:hypothetical protein
VYKQNCLVVGTVDYLYETAISADVRVLPCNSGRSWSRYFQYQVELGGNDGGGMYDGGGGAGTQCGGFGRDCLDQWRFNYDSTMISRAPEVGGKLTGARGEERDQAFYGGDLNWRASDGDDLTEPPVSTESDNYNNGTISPVNQPWLCLTQESNETTQEAFVYHGAGVALQECDSRLSQKWNYTTSGHIKNQDSMQCLQFTTVDTRYATCRAKADWDFDLAAVHNNFNGHAYSRVNPDPDPEAKATLPNIVAAMFYCDEDGFDKQEEEDVPMKTTDETEPLEDGWENEACDRDFRMQDVTQFNPEFFQPTTTPPNTHGAYYYDMDYNVRIVDNILDYAESRGGWAEFAAYDPSNTSESRPPQIVPFLRRQLTPHPPAARPFSRCRDIRARGQHVRDARRRRLRRRRVPRPQALLRLRRRQGVPVE